VTREEQRIRQNHIANRPGKSGVAREREHAAAGTRFWWVRWRQQRSL